MKVKSKNVSWNRVLIPLIFVLFAIILEIVNFSYLGFVNSSGNIMILPTYFLFDFSIILIIAGIIYLVYNKTASLILFYFFITIQFLMNIVNSTMYFIFGDILSYELLKLGAEATTALTMDFVDWGGVFLNIMIYSLMIFISILLVKFNKKTFEIKNFSKVTLFLASFIFIEAIGFSLFQIQQSTLAQATSAQTEIETSDEYLWKNFQFKIDAFKKFGFYGFYTKSFINYIFKENLTDNEIEELQNFIDDGYQEGNEDAILYGDNLIVILCESFEWYAVDPYNTPTLYNLLYQNENTVVFNEFYARNRTNYSEGIVLLGSVPKNIFIPSAAESGYNFEYSLPRLFEHSSSDEVTTSYIHGNFENFYDRNLTHGEEYIGFDNLYTIEDYTGPYVYTTFNKWIPEISFVENQIDNIIPDEGRFLSFYVTLSTHGPYDYNNPNFEEYYQIFDDNYENFSVWFEQNTNYVIPEGKDFELFKHYKAASIDFDRVVEKLIKTLEEKGRDDDTSIVFFADHNAYYSDLCYKVRGTEKTDYENTYNYNIPMFIYSKKLANGNHVEIEDFCNTYDILPTICDLYGLESNSNLFHGYSIFSEEIKNSIFVSNLSGIFTNKIYSQNISDVALMDDSITKEDIAHFKEIANRFYRDQEKIEKIYRYGINGTKNYIS